MVRFTLVAAIYYVAIALPPSHFSDSSSFILLNKTTYVKKGYVPAVVEGKPILPYPTSDASYNQRPIVLASEKSEHKKQNGIDLNVSDMLVVHDYDTPSKENKNEKKKNAQKMMDAEVTNVHIGKDLYSIWKKKHNEDRPKNSPKNSPNIHEKENEKNLLDQGSTSKNKAKVSHGINIKKHTNQDETSLQNLINDENEKERDSQRSKEFESYINYQRGVQNNLQNNLQKISLKLYNTKQRLQSMQSSVDAEAEEIQNMQANEKLNEKKIMILQHRNEKLTNFIKSWYRSQKDRQERDELSKILTPNNDGSRLSKIQKNEISALIEEQVKKQMGKQIDNVGFSSIMSKKGLYTHNYDDYDSSDSKEPKNQIKSIPQFSNYHGIHKSYFQQQQQQQQQPPPPFDDELNLKNLNDDFDMHVHNVANVPNYREYAKGTSHEKDLNHHYYHYHHQHPYLQRQIYTKKGPSFNE